MLPHVTRGVRVALILALSSAYIGWHSHTSYAKGGGDDDSAGGDDDDDDSGGGGDKKGGDDDDDDSGNDKDQPPVTAGGLFTLKTYPQNENLRPLTITHGVTQLKLGIGTDLSAKGAFKSAGVSLDAVYGVRDNVMIIGGFDDAYNFKQFDVYAGIETSIKYDLVDFRAALHVRRNAYANYGLYCDPASANDMGTGGLTQPTSCGNPMADPTMAVALPNGKYGAGNIQASLDLGVPIRYAFKPQIAVVLFQKVLSIDFNKANIDHVLFEQSTDASGNPINVNSPVSNGGTPDLDLSAAVAINPINQLAILISAEFKLADFDTAADNFQLPVSIQIEGSVSHQLDIGLQFTLLNVIPPDPQGAADNRYISIYAQYRL